MGPLVLSVLDFGGFCPWVSKPGWIHHHLCSSVASAQRSTEPSLVAGTGHIFCKVNYIFRPWLGFMNSDKTNLDLKISKLQLFAWGKVCSALTVRHVQHDFQLSG